MKSRAKTKANKGNEQVTIDLLRKELSAEQQDFLNTCWQHYLQARDWPRTFPLHRRHGKDHVRKLLKPLSGNILTEMQDGSRGDYYELSLLGILLTKDGPSYFQLLVRFLEFLRDKYVNEEGNLQISDKEVAKALSLSDEQRSLLGILGSLDHDFRTAHVGEGWGVIVPKEIENVPRTGPLDIYREHLVLRYFKRDTPVFYEDRRNIQFAAPQLLLSSAYETAYGGDATGGLPPEIAESIELFKTQHPVPELAAFIMMRFGTTKAHDEIFQAVRKQLQKHEIAALRADHRDYHDDLWFNILTYIHGCGFGIAVFERLERDDFNPNVALEVGYMMALRKPILLLKDKTLKSLNTDLIGRLFKTFDPQAISETVGPQVQRWLKDKDLAI